MMTQSLTSCKFMEIYSIISFSIFSYTTPPKTSNDDSVIKARREMKNTRSKKNQIKNLRKLFHFISTIRKVVYLSNWKLFYSFPFNIHPLLDLNSQFSVDRSKARFRVNFPTIQKSSFPFLSMKKKSKNSRRTRRKTIKLLKVSQFLICFTAPHTSI